MIVGAGVIGSYLAKLVGGCEVWERNKHVVEKTCSSLVSLEGMRAARVDWKPLILNRVRGAVFHTCGRSLEVSRQKPVAVVLDRLGLQKTLVADAENAGCTIKWGKAWCGEQDDFVIGADGALSAVAAHWGARRKALPAFQVKCGLRTDSEFVHFFFSEFAPGFFAWIIPFDERSAEVGLACAKGSPTVLFNRFVKQAGLKLGGVRQKQAGFIPVFNPRLPTVFGNTALVGDAAGQVKASTGGGIVYGFKCAELLAEALAGKDLAWYEREWRKRYERELKFHLLIRRLLDRASLQEVFDVLNKKAFRELLCEKASMDRPSVLVKEVLKRPGLWPVLLKLGGRLLRDVRKSE